MTNACYLPVPRGYACDAVPDDFIIYPSFQVNKPHLVNFVVMKIVRCHTRWCFPSSLSASVWNKGLPAVINNNLVGKWCMGHIFNILRVMYFKCRLKFASLVSNRTVLECLKGDHRIDAKLRSNGCLQRCLCLLILITFSHCTLFVEYFNC